MKKFFKIVFISIGVLAVLLVVASFVLPSIVSVDDYSDEIKTEFAKKTGYELGFDEIDLSVFPVVHATVKNASVSNGTKTLAVVTEVNAYADIWKLLQGELSIDSVEVNSPTIYYEKYASGSSWELKPEARAEVAAEGGAESSEKGFSIESISVLNGAVKYDDNIGGADYELSKLQLNTSFRSLSNPVEAVGEFEFGGSAFEFDVKLPSAGSDDLALNLSGLGTKVSFSGSAEKGDFEISSADVNKLAALLKMQDKVNLPKR